MRISDWSSDVCSSDLDQLEAVWDLEDAIFNCYARHSGDSPLKQEPTKAGERWNIWTPSPLRNPKRTPPAGLAQPLDLLARRQLCQHFRCRQPADGMPPVGRQLRSAEHTSELQSLMRITYAVS